MKSQGDADKPDRPTSRAKRRAALAAAEAQFLATGYESVTMDSIARESRVAKQTLYSYFGSKRELFLALVTAKTQAASKSVVSSAPHMTDPATARDQLRELLVGQLEAVMTPEVLALRRLVIGESVRSPELARALYEFGPRAAIAMLAQLIADLGRLGALRVADAPQAATQLNWLVMGDPINRAMLLGDEAIPSATQMRAHVDAALDVFFAAFAP